MKIPPGPSVGFTPKVSQTVLSFTQADSSAGPPACDANTHSYAYTRYPGGFQRAPLTALKANHQILNILNLSGHFLSTPLPRPRPGLIIAHEVISSPGLCPSSDSQRLRCLEARTPAHPLLPSRPHPVGELSLWGLSQPEAFVKCEPSEASSLNKEGADGHTGLGSG